MDKLDTSHDAVNSTSTDDNSNTNNDNSNVPNPVKRAKLGHHHPARASSDPIAKQKALLDKLMANPQKVIKTEALSQSARGSPSTVIPDIVANIPGSSSGASSGQFHIYKHARRRELERLQTFDQETKAKKADEEWEARRELAKIQDQARVGKNKKRRDKRKSNPAKKLTADVDNENASGDNNQNANDNNNDNEIVAAPKVSTVIIDEDDF